MNMFGKTDPKDREKEAIRREAYRRIERETYGMNIAQLKEWSKNRMKEELTTEMAKQQIAVAKVRDFLDAIGIIYYNLKLNLYILFVIVPIFFV